MLTQSIKSFRQRFLKKYSLRVYIFALFLPLLFVLASAIISVQYVEGQNMLLSSSKIYFENIRNQTVASLNHSYDLDITGVSILANSPIHPTQTEPERLRHIPQLVSYIRSSEELTAIYIGYSNADFFFVSEKIENIHPTPETYPSNTAYFVGNIVTNAQGVRVGHYYFYDEKVNLINETPIEVVGNTSNYDPRKRPWYKHALDKNHPSATSIYAYNSGALGTSIVQRTRDGSAVVGVDISQERINDILLKLRPTPRSQLFVINQDNQIIASTDPEFQGKNVDGQAQIPDMNAPSMSSTKDWLNQRPQGAVHFQPIVINKKQWLRTSAPLAIQGARISLIMITPSDELLSQTYKLRDRGLLTALIIMLAAIPLIFLLARFTSRPLQALIGEVTQIQSLKFNGDSKVHSPIAEIESLANSISTMKSVIRRFMKMGTSLVQERNFDKLLNSILKETMRLTLSRYGVIYLTDAQGKLNPIQARGSDAICVKNGLQPLDPILDAKHPAMIAHQERRALIDRKSDHWKVSQNSDQGLIYMAIPLQDRDIKNIGVLVLATPETTFEKASEQDLLSAVQAVSNAASIAINTQQLIQEQKQLLESLMQLIAGAIDAKSPYTGSHCQRVPYLAKKLAAEAEKSTNGAFKDFHLTDDQWEELHIAAWLHDCGKVTTPEYVIDKASKLETLYNRIHEIRIRFELIKREAEVQAWKDISAGAAKENRLAELETLCQCLDEEFAFIARCNSGNETITPQALDRLQTIAQRTWTRTLDDRLGLSPEEEKRYAHTPAAQTPTQEKLLADKPEHIIERSPQELLADKNDPYEFKVDKPEHLYNRGELYNLCIPNGTLTAEERYKINEHIIETIRMLSRLPLPRHLSQLVEIAGCHHERMDGSGYPRRLKGEEICLQARIMAIADIFEALTAQDRPYKKRKQLSEAISILATMSNTGHIDPELFKLFLRSGVYLDYAKRFMSPEQIDEIDLSRYL